MKKNKLGKRLDVLEWLLDPNDFRATGRSYTILIAYVRIALKYPNQWITVRDHYASHVADDMLLGSIRAWVKSNLKKEKAEFKRGEFRILK